MQSKVNYTRYLHTLFISILVFFNLILTDSFANDVNDSFYYNKGTHFLLNKEYAHAYAYLQRAYLRSPFDSNRIENLRLAAQKIQNKSQINEVESRVESFIFNPYFNLFIPLLSAILSIFSFIWIIFFIRKKPILYPTGIFLILSIVYLFFFLSFDIYSMQKYAVIIEPTKALSLPKDDSSVIVELETPKKVKIIENNGKWSQVVYSAMGHRAWILSSHLLPLTSK